MNLTIEEMKRIVDGAPDWAITYCLSFGDYYEGGVASVPCEDCLFISNLRTAISNHNTDHCVDITNHISPLTKVIER